ncbi:hypothetical protein IVA80_30785 [Bradyrhizobium sp. 139]|uniref:hypothetical protein n=1 Tax=Bradyrhizobium sp. 139 TaxID=2782616 RepID=UPI001FF8D398|nr:hypothetical protein [Bradyrhizobium sp. 139]MCK1745086.1 hypothetical protein [Bradyrhizobium sp. 139]
MNERLMERDDSSSAVRSGFHPLIYKAAIALVALFVIAAWVAFDRQSDIELPLAILSVLLFVAVFLPYLLWRRCSFPTCFGESGARVRHNRQP